jgi:hypothetical protein
MAEVLSSTEAHCVTVAGAVGNTVVALNQMDQDTQQPADHFAFAYLDHTNIQVSAQEDTISVSNDVISCRFQTVVIRSHPQMAESACHVMTHEPSWHLEVSINELDYNTIVLAAAMEARQRSR